MIINTLFKYNHEHWPYFKCTKWQLLRRSSEVESSVQTESGIEVQLSKRRNIKGPSTPVTSECGTQVMLQDLPEVQDSVVAALRIIVNESIEQAFMEVIEEEEILEIRERRAQFREIKLAELTTAKLLDMQIE